MPSERAIVPPLRKPVGELLNANHRDGHFTELINRDDSAYRAVAPIKRGTLYSTLVGAKQEVIDAFPQGLYFCKEIRPGQSSDFGNTDQFCLWIWATDLLAQSVENSEVTYESGSVAHPGFTRTVQVRRDAYDAAPSIASLSPLTTLIAINVTAPGTGYTSAVVAIAGPGTGAAAEAVLGPTGAVIAIIVTKEGFGYVTAPAVTITGDGAGATAEGVIQPQSAVLVGQKKQEYPSDSLLSHEFVQVLREYATLPGPEKMESGWDEQSGCAVKIYTQRVALPATKKTQGAQYPLATGFYVLDSDAIPDASAIVGVLTTVTMQLPGPAQAGQTYNREFDVPEPFSQHWAVLGTGVGTNRVESIPVDAVRAKVTTLTPDLNFYLITPGTADFQLPDVLESIQIVWEVSTGEGESDETGVGDAVGTHGSLSLSLSSTAQGSVVIMPEIQPKIKQFWARDLPTQNHWFMLPSPVTDADIIAKIQGGLTRTASGVVAGVVTTTAAHGLRAGQPFAFASVTGGAGGITALVTYYVLTTPTTTTFTYAATSGGAALSGHSSTSGTLYPTVQAWPRFKPEMAIFTLFGAKLALQSTAVAQQHASFDDSGANYGYSRGATEGYSNDVGQTVTTKTLPFTIHGVITPIADPDHADVRTGNRITLSEETDARAYAHIAAGGAGTLGLWLAVTAGNTNGVPRTDEAGTTATGSIFPKTLPATVPPGMPTAGLYFREPGSSPYAGALRMRVEVFNFADL